MLKNRYGVLALGLSTLALAVSAPALAHSTVHNSTTVKVTAGKPSEFKFSLSTSSVKAGVVTFTVTNQGALKHDFKISGHTTKQLAKGQSAVLKVTLKKGKYTYECTVPGHAAAGMKGTFKVA